MTVTPPGMVHINIICCMEERYKTLPVQPWSGPDGSNRLRLSEFLDWHMKLARLRVSTLHTGHLHTSGVKRPRSGADHPPNLAQRLKKE